MRSGIRLARTFSSFRNRILPICNWWCELASSWNYICIIMFMKCYHFPSSRGFDQKESLFSWYKFAISL